MDNNPQLKKEMVQARKFYDKLNPKTETISVRLSKKTLAAIDLAWRKEEAPSRQAWLENALQHALGEN
jgi:hypothetical protein